MFRPARAFSTFEGLRSFCAAADSRLGAGFRAGRTDTARLPGGPGETGPLLSRSVEAVAAAGVEADLRMEIDEGVDAIRYATDEASLRVREPESLWPCTCRGPWLGDIDADEPCPIHGRPGGTAVSEAFLDGTVLTRYRDVDVYWFHSESLFPVTVDALYLYENLLADGVADRDVSSVLDVGCGAGFASVALAARDSTRGPGIEELALCDCYATPLAVSGLNHRVNDARSECRLLLTDGLRRANGRDLAAGPGADFDVCLCNPPYLPEMDDGGPAAPGFTGVELLNEVVASADVAETVYLHVSEIAERDARAAAAREGVELRPVGERRTVPFRVHPSLYSEAYVEFLRERGLTVDGEEPFPYRHDVVTYALV